MPSNSFVLTPDVEAKISTQAINNFYKQNTSYLKKSNLENVALSCYGNDRRNVFWCGRNFARALTT